MGYSGNSDLPPVEGHLDIIQGFGDLFRKSLALDTIDQMLMIRLGKIGPAT